MSTLFRLFDTIILATLACGIVAMLQPWWGNGLRVGFFSTSLAIILHNISSRLPRQSRS